MSEEEKKIIETVENFIKYYKKNEQTGNRANLDVLREECNAIEFILNKYDKQQKEIKNLAKRQNDLIDEYENELLEKNNYIFQLENEKEALHKLIDEEM